MTTISTVLVAGSSGHIGHTLVEHLLGKTNHHVIGLDVEDLQVTDPRFEFFRGSVLDRKFLDKVSNKISHSNLELVGIVNTFVYPEFNNELPTATDELKQKFPHISSRTIELLSAWSKFPEEPALEAFRLNCLGANNVVASQLENLLSSSGCSVVNIASQYGIKAPRQGLFESPDRFVYKPFAYSTSKAALIMLSKYQASLFSNTNVRVNSVSPGVVSNGHSKEFVARLEKSAWTKGIAEVEQIIGPIMFLLSKESMFMNGANLVIDGGWTET